MPFSIHIYSLRTRQNNLNYNVLAVKNELLENYEIKQCFGSKVSTWESVLFKLEVFDKPGGSEGVGHIFSSTGKETALRHI